MASTTPHHITNSTSTSPTAVALDLGGTLSGQVQTRESSECRNRRHGKAKNSIRHVDGDASHNKYSPGSPLLQRPAVDKTTLNYDRARRRKGKNPAAKRPTVDVSKLGNFKQKIGMLQDSRNLRFRKIYKAPDPIVIAVFVGSILLWYILFNYLRTWE